jgi:quinoprotein glucose dehydrogenase
MKRTIRAFLVAACCGTAAVSAQNWAQHGGDAGESRFSPLKQITAANIATLATAWTFDLGMSNLQLTPLVVDGVMYVSGASNVFALEPETGKVLWRFETPAPVGRRGVAYWPGDGTAGPRVLQPMNDRVIALDAKTGRLATNFGGFGWIDLKHGVRGDRDGRITLITPPVVYKNIIITGSNNEENTPSLGLYGDIRGWDARSGKLLWQFHTVPRPGEPGNGTWEGDSWKDRSGTNVWSYFSLDAERGIVYAPLGVPTSDYYGGDRKGKNLYGNSVVALDATTGKLQWYQNSELRTQNSELRTQASDKRRASARERERWRPFGARQAPGLKFRARGSLFNLLPDPS